MLRLLVPVVVIAFTIYCVLDIVLSPRDRVRTLTKPGWIAPVILLPPVGGIAWLLFGRPGTDVTPGGGGGQPAVRDPGPRPTRPSGAPGGGGPPRPRGPDDDPDFLRRLGDRLRRGKR